MLPPSNLKLEFLDSPLPASGVSVANELADCLRFVWTLLICYRDIDDDDDDDNNTEYNSATAAAVTATVESLL